jgi:hypothetical protein
MIVPPCFRQVWLIDSEYYQPDGERPTPICLVAREYYSGAVIRHWLWREVTPQPPFAPAPDVLAVCYYAPAEWSVFLALGWPLPVRILDLCAEYRWLKSGLRVPCGQLDALRNFSLPCMETAHKDDMRTLCRRGGPFSSGERRDIISYCGEDVNELAALFGKMGPDLQWPQALARGRYTAALARVEDVGIPLDRNLYRRLRASHEAIRRELIVEVGGGYGIYDDTRFDTDAFGQYLVRHDISWPRTPTGRLATDEDTLEEMSVVYPQLRPLHELHGSLGQLKNDGGLAVGRDARNRSQLWPFSTSSGRNAPSTTRFVFGKSVAFRHLIKPDPGWAVAYVDWGQQEFAIAAVLSGDHNMR